MANQFKSALHYAYEELEPQLKKWYIFVDADRRYATYKSVRVNFRPGLTKGECRSRLKKMIAAAEKADIDEHQAKLL